MRVAAGIALLLACHAAAAAHEIGRTQVAVTFDAARGYRIDMLVDPDALLTRLEILAGESPSPPADAAQVADRIAALEGVLMDHLAVRFDARTVRPQVELVPAARAAESLATFRAADGAIVRLTGQAPEGARTFTWASRLVFGAYALTIEGPGDPQPATEWLVGGQASKPFDLGEGARRVSRAEVAQQYLVLGFTHILPKGLDHILFVLGIFLLTPAWKSILLQVSAFTVAHSITLGLTIYGLVSAPPSIVEPLIALSIAYVAIENLLTEELKPWRVALVFAFGLLHGMGFAGVLGELGLPRSAFLTALVTFNLGVEAGQLAVILLASLLLAGWRHRAPFRRLVVVPASVAIAIVGVYWTVERLA